MTGFRSSLAVALLVLAVALLPFATAFWTALPAPGWLAAVVAAGAALAMRRGGPPSARHDAPIAAAFGVAASAAHVAPGLVVGHDVVDHVWGAWAYLQAWHAGDWLPIWLHHLGLGEPMPLFYGPLPFWAMAPFALAGGGPPVMVSGSFVLAATVASLGAWNAVARWTGDRRAALVAAIAMAYAPYRLFDAHYRTALGEAWAVALTPIALFAFERLLARPSRGRFAGAAGATAAMALAHPISLVLLAVALATMAVSRWLRLRTAVEPGAAARSVGAGALAALVGLGLAGFFCVPLAFESRFLDLRPSLGAPGEESYLANGVQPIDLVARHLWDHLDFSLSDAGELAGEWPEQPYYFGLVLLAALLGAALLRRSEASDSPQRTLFAVGVVCLAFSLAVVASVAGTLPGLALLQFPWRFLGPATAASALAAGLIVPALEQLRWRLPPGSLALALALALLADGFPFSGAVGRLRSWHGLAAASRFASGLQQPTEIPHPWPQRVYGPIFPPAVCCADVALTNPIYREYFSTPTRELAMHLASSGVGLQIRRGRATWLRRIEPEPYAQLHGRRAAPYAVPYTRGAGRITTELPHGRGGRLVVLEQYFPGWQVDLGRGWREVVPTQEGLLAANVPRRLRRVGFRFDRWRWDRTLGWAATLLSAGLLVAVPGIARSGRSRRR